MSLNKVMLIGNLGSDPELRTTSGGNSVCNFNIATNESYTDREGNRQNKTEWHRIVVWGKQAENCDRFLSKGRQVYIEGKLQTREWDDRDGNQRRSTEIVAQSVVFLSNGQDGRSRSDRDRSGDSARPRPQNNVNQSFNDEDIPF